MLGMHPSTGMLATGFGSPLLPLLLLWLLLLCDARDAPPRRAPARHRLPDPAGRPAGPSPLAQEVGEQARLAGPLALNLIANYSLNIVSLSFVVSTRWAAMPAKLPAWPLPV